MELARRASWVLILAVPDDPDVRMPSLSIGFGLPPLCLLTLEVTEVDDTLGSRSQYCTPTCALLRVGVVERSFDL